MLSFSIFSLLFATSINSRLFKRQEDLAALAAEYNAEVNQIPLCVNGQIQSPINFNTSDTNFTTVLNGILPNPTLELPNIRWPNQTGYYQKFPETVRFFPDSNVTATFTRNENETYNLLQWHYHTPAEHTVDGVQYPAEFHFVHINSEGKIAVIGAFARLSMETSPLIRNLLEIRAGIKNNGNTANGMSDYFEVLESIKKSQTFFRYTGSLTADSCLEGIKWLVAAKPSLFICQSDLELLMGLDGVYSARAVQPLVKNANDPQWFSTRVSDYTPETNELQRVYNEEMALTPVCVSGQIQSPIDFATTNSNFTSRMMGVLQNPTLSLPNVNYPTTQTGYYEKFVDTVRFFPNATTAATFDRGVNGTYTLLQWHFHTPAEHTVDGYRYPAEFHFVHTNPDGTFAVIGAFAKLALTSSPLISNFLSNSAALQTNGNRVTATVNYTDFVANLKLSPTFFRYTGSLTAPPCLEGIKWLVASRVVFDISRSDIKALQALDSGYSARNIQPLFTASNSNNWVSSRMSDYFPN